MKINKEFKRWMDNFSVPVGIPINLSRAHDCYNALANFTLTKNKFVREFIDYMDVVRNMRVERLTNCRLMVVENTPSFDGKEMTFSTLGTRMDRMSFEIFTSPGFANWFEENFDAMTETFCLTKYALADYLDKDKPLSLEGVLFVKAYNGAPMAQVTTPIFHHWLTIGNIYRNGQKAMFSRNHKGTTFKLSK